MNNIFRKDVREVGKGGERQRTEIKKYANFLGCRTNFIHGMSSK